MDITWNSSRLLGYCAIALALALNANAQFSQTTAQTSNSTNMNRKHSRHVVIESAPAAFQYSAGGGWSHDGAIQNAGAWATRGSLPFTIPGGAQPFVYSGLTTGNSGVLEATAAATTFTFSYRLSPTSPILSYTYDVPAATCIMSYNSGSSFNFHKNSPPIILTYSVANGVVFTDPLDDPEDVYESGIFLLQNLTGEDQEFQLGDEVITLKPGMNSVPYHSKLDSEGFPNALPDGFLGVKKNDGDGKPYIYGTLKYGIEYQADWSAAPIDPNAVQIFPETESAGPTVKTPGSNGSPIYNQLPKGMTPSFGNPLPAGMTIGTAGLPLGMTPGANGALRAGVASGGTSQLPSGVSPGIFPNPYPSGSTLPPSGIRPIGKRTFDPGVIPGTPAGTPPPSAPSGTTPSTTVPGGSVVQTGESDQETGGVYGAGSNMAGASDQATALGEAGSREVSQAMSKSLGKISTAVANPLGVDSGKFWTAPGQGYFSGVDTSWMTLQVLGIPNLPAMNISIPPQWITLVRAIMLWVIRIFFVLGCIKLIMK